MTPQLSGELGDELRARLVSGASPTNVAAIMVGSTAPDGLDGQRLRLAVSDGHNTETIEATRSATAGPLTDDEVVDLVERRAGSYPLESRLPDLLADLDGEPMVLR